MYIVLNVFSFVRAAAKPGGDSVRGGGERWVGRDDLVLPTAARHHRRVTHPRPLHSALSTQQPATQGECTFFRGLTAHSSSHQSTPNCLV